MEIPIAPVRRTVERRPLFIVTGILCLLLSLLLKTLYWWEGGSFLSSLHGISEGLLLAAIIVGVIWHSQGESGKERLLRAEKTEHVRMQISYKHSWRLLSSALLVLAILVWLSLLLRSLWHMQTTAYFPEYMLALLGGLLAAYAIRNLWINLHHQPFRILLTERAIIFYKDMYKEVRWNQIKAIERHGPSVYFILKHQPLQKIDLSELGLGKDSFDLAIKEQAMYRGIVYWEGMR